jgi:hypothetical protein
MKTRGYEAKTVLRHGAEFEISTIGLSAPPLSGPRLTSAPPSLDLVERLGDQGGQEV